MKEKKKPRRTKAEIRAYKKRSRLAGTAIIIVILIVVIAFSSFLIYSYLNPSSSNEPPTPPPELELRAAIVDHLSLTIPNESFNKTVTNILKAAEYAVRLLPRRRSHGGILQKPSQTWLWFDSFEGAFRPSGRRKISPVPLHFRTLQRNKIRLGTIN